MAKKILITIAVIMLVSCFSSQVMASNLISSQAATMNQLSSRAIAVDPISIATWIIGFISTRPQTFYTSIGSVDLIVDMPPDFKTKYGLIETDTLYLKPYSQNEAHEKQTANSQGACFRTISRQDGGKTSINVFFPHDKNGQISDGVYRVYHVPDCANGTGASSEIVDEGHFTSNNFSMNYRFNDSMNPYRIVAYPLSPKNMKDTAVNLTVYSRTLSFYAREIQFEKNGQLGQMMYDAEANRVHESNKDKRTASLNIKIRGKNTSTNLVIIDQYGEVFRGITPSQDFNVQVAPGTVGIMRGQGEGELISIPNMPNGLVNVRGGSENEVMLAPPDCKIVNSPCGTSSNYDGRIKIFAPNGCKARVELFDGAVRLVDTNFPITTFYGAEVAIKQNKPISEIAVTVNGNRISRKVIYFNQPLVYDFETPQYKSYSLHNVDPVVPGGLSYKNDKDHQRNSVVPFVASNLFYQKCLELNIPSVAINRVRDKFIGGRFGYTMAGPEVKLFEEFGRKFKSVDKIKGLTSGSERGKKEFYFLRFKEYCRIWIPEGEVGWVIGIDSVCGNVYMVWIEPVYQTPKITYIPIPVAPPSIDVPRISLSYLYVGGDNARNSSWTNNPTAPPPYIPEAKIEINNSNLQSQSQGQTQHQGQHQGQTSTNNNNNNNYNNNVNNNTNINTNNNINQNQNTNNVLVPISVVNGGN